jgi:hypothetical protein
MSFKLAYMKSPTSIQLFFASKLYHRTWHGLFIISTISFFAFNLIPVYFDSPTFLSALKFLFYISLSGPLGFFLSIFFAVFFLSPLTMFRAQINGAPFEVGDTVLILSGNYKNTVSKVYSKWQGVSVRVELGEFEKEKFYDVFSPLELMKIEPSNG